MDRKEIQEKWKREWEQAKVFETNPDPSREKFFITVAYPYPNSPQHIGHARTYTLTDVHARYLRMRGYNVLFPMAFHYTGTPILAMAERIAKGEIVDLVSEDERFTLELNHYEKDSPHNTAYIVGEGLDHLAFDVDDLDKAIEELRTAGHRVILEVKMEKSRWAYVEDPNGIWIELL